MKNKFVCQFYLISYLFDVTSLLSDAICICSNEENQHGHKEKSHRKEEDQKSCYQEEEKVVFLILGFNKRPWILHPGPSCFWG